MSYPPADDFRDLSVPEMEARLKHFEMRVNGAIASCTPSKNWVREALQRKGAQRCPVRIKRLSMDVILRYGDALADLFCEYPDDVVAMIPYDITVGYQLPDKQPRINPVEVLMHDAQWIDEWGTGWGHARVGVGATPVSYPIQDWSQLDAYLRDGMPDPEAAGRLDAIKGLFEAHREDRYCFGIIHLALFERFHALRGMENALTDFCLYENESRRLLDALECYLRAIIRRWGDLGADGVFMTDDWGSQGGLLIAPELWRSMFKPYYQRVFDEVHKLGMDVIFHSCGNVLSIIGDLIDIGMDVLDPVQPGAMDIDLVAREYGGKIAFCGTVDIQELLCHCTPGQVYDETRRIIDTLGKPFGNALMIGPANVITPDAPLENLEALFKASHEAGSHTL